MGGESCAIRDVVGATELTWQMINADVREGLAQLDAGSVQCVITSPPYFGLRNYGVDGQIGMEATPQAFVCALVEVFRDVRRVLRDDGVCFVNLGDSYAGSGKGPTDASQIGKQFTGVSSKSTLAGYTSENVKIRQQVLGSGGRVEGLKPKDLCLIPERFALAMQDDGWWVRSRIAWCKTACMPESVTDRPTNAWEHIWLFTKKSRYYWDQEAVRVPLASDNLIRTAVNGLGNGELGAGSRNGSPQTSGRNLWNYWFLGPEPYADAHFATFPTEIPRLAISAGTSERGCCPTCGAPWRRVTASENLTKRPVGGKLAELVTAGSRQDGNLFMGNPVVTTTGWSLSCSCPEQTPVPCQVLDPFAGSGTTLLVAERLGRDSIGIELNPTYVELARKRITGDAPLFNVAAEVRAAGADGRG